MSFGHILLTSLALFSAACIVAVVFFERKSPASSLAWILVLLFLPGIGFVMYLFLGSGFRVNKRKKYALKAITDNLYNTYIVKHLNLGRSRIFLDDHENSTRLLTYLKKEGEGVFTDNNDVDVYVDGEALFKDMKEDMRNATHHIHVLFYIFRNDELGKEILEILTEKAKAGVEVRVIYDCIGTMMAFDTMFRELMKAGGEVEGFSPLFKNLNSHLRLNYRNHRKIVVIDGKVGYLGGMNIGLEYVGKDKKLVPWRDTHLRLTGSSVWFLQERFFMDWSYCTDLNPQEVEVSTYFPQPQTNGNVGIQIISSGPDTFESPIKSGMLTMIYAAQKNVYIQTPYFAPDESFFDALRIAARSDVDVRLMIPRISDYEIVHRATLGYAKDAMEAGVKIYMYHGFLHAKTIVADGVIATIGTTNITNRSFTLDFEVNAFIYDTVFAENYERIFLADQENCDIITPEYFERQSTMMRASYNVARLFATMM